MKTFVIVVFQILGVVMFVSASFLRSIGDPDATWGMLLAIFDLLVVIMLKVDK